MAGKFNFNATIGLDSAGFKRGVNQVKTSLSGLKSTFLQVAGALGAGLGLGQFISSLRVTATELSTAMNTLKNVSYVTKKFKDETKDVTIEMSNYQENLNFVHRLSRDYHQDLVAITDNYAKFIAACKKTNLSLENQRFVFESLTRAAAFYHLTADRTNDMMNAVVQMMSKGKVAAEELRRQLGNTLPGAFNMMAAAMKVSTSELDRMMKAGELVASEALPRFAAMLNSVTKNIEFDSIQAAMNDLKNTWYEFVQTSGAENLYKNIVKGATKTVSFVNDNIKGIQAGFAGLFTFLISSNIWNIMERRGSEWIKNLEKDLKLIEKNIAKTEAKLAGVSGVKKSANGVATHAHPTSLSSVDIDIMQDYNDMLLKQYQTQYRLGIISRKQWRAIRAEIQAAQAQLVGLTSATSTATAATGRLGLAWRGFKDMVVKAGKSLKTFFASNWVFLLISALTSVITYIKRVKDDIKEVMNITRDYNAQIEQINKGVSEDAVLLRKRLELVKDTSQAESSRLLALKEINKTMGTSYTLDELDNIKGKYEEITTEVERWIEATKTQAMMQAYASQITEATAKKLEAQRKIQEEADRLTGKGQQSNSVLPPGTPVGLKMIWKWAFGDLEKEAASIKEYEKVIANAEEQLKALGAELGDFFDILDENDEGEATALDKLMTDYNKQQQELANQLKEGAKNQDEYNEALDKLVQSFWEKAAATGELSISEITSKLKKGEALEELEDWYYKLSKAAMEAAKKALLKTAEKEMADALEESIAEASKAADEAIEKYIDEENKRLEKQLDLDVAVAGGDFDTQKRQDRNTLFDYGKKGSEKTSEELAQTNAWLEDIKRNYKDLIDESTELGYKTEIVQKKLDELSQLYQHATREAQTLEAAMNYQKVVEDIENVRKEINSLVYSGVKDFATSMDRVVSSWKTLKETMNDSDATGWDKFMAIFNMMTQVIDSAMGIYQTITTLQQLQTKLGATKLAEQTALNALLKEELALRMAAQGASNEEIQQRMTSLATLFTEKGLLGGILGLKQQENAASATGAALKGAEAAASATAASASAGEAIAGATASGSKMPYPLNLIAIATGIAAVIAALASMKKFAHGGIVGGTSTSGDHNLARVNSGEMILNKAQQGTLFSMLNGKGGMGGNVEFKIRGADLVGTINNYSKKISK